jgi:hypothetical protein
MKIASPLAGRKPKKVRFVEVAEGLVLCNECQAEVPFTYAAVQQHARDAHGAEHFGVITDITFEPWEQ